MVLIGRPRSVVAAVAGALVAVGMLVLMVVVEARPAEATFPGQNGKIAYVGDEGVIYTINPNGEAQTKVTEGSDPSYSPNGKKIAYSCQDPAGGNSEICTINVGGEGKHKLTNSDTYDSSPS
jgi:hypothetical protein